MSAFTRIFFFKYAALDLFILGRRVGKGLGFRSRTLCTSPRAPCISPHWHRFFLLDHVVQVGQRALQLPAVDGLRRFAGVFEGDAEVGAAGAGGLGGLDLGGCVADLEIVMVG